MELVRQAADALERAEAERDEMRASIGRITTEEALTLRAERDALRALLAEVLPWAPLHKNLRDRIDAMLRESGK
jgi:hypothetical protein